MIDKVQKIREEVARIQLYTQSEVLKQVLDYIDKVQEEPVSTKDKLLALSDGRLHLGWIDDAKVVEFEECLMQFHEDMNNIPQGTDSLTRLKDTDGVLHSYSKKLMSMAKEEPVSEFLNAESMIESYKQRLISQVNGMKNSPLVSMCLASYKHGINETLDTLNLSNVQRTVKNWKEEPIIEVLNRYLDRVPDEEVLKTKMAINEWFNVYFPKLQEEPVSEDLEDVSKRYALRQVMASTDTQLTEQAYLSLRLFNGYDLAVAHKDGANWQKNKMMKDSMDGIIAESAGCDGWVNVMTGFVKSKDVNVKFGDKIKIIVVKED